MPAISLTQGLWFTCGSLHLRDGGERICSLLRWRGSGGLEEGDGGVDRGCSPGFAPGGDVRCCGRGQATGLSGGVPGLPNPDWEGSPPPPLPCALPAPDERSRRGSAALAACRTSRPS